MLADCRIVDEGAEKTVNFRDGLLSVGSIVDVLLFQGLLLLCFMKGYTNKVRAFSTDLVALVKSRGYVNEAQITIACIASADSPDTWSLTFRHKTSKKTSNPLFGNI
jgi:hypothetical protein